MRAARSCSSGGIPFSTSWMLYARRYLTPNTLHPPGKDMVPGRDLAPEITPWTEWQTHAYEKITFPQLQFLAVFSGPWI